MLKFIGLFLWWVQFRTQLDSAQLLIVTLYYFLKVYFSRKHYIEGKNWYHSSMNSDIRQVSAHG